jgi:hypothetical protein
LAISEQSGEISNPNSRREKWVKKAPLRPTTFHNYTVFGAGYRSESLLLQVGDDDLQGPLTKFFHQGHWTTRGANGFWRRDAAADESGNNLFGGASDVIEQNGTRRVEKVSVGARELCYSSSLPVDISGTARTLLRKSDRAMASR